MIFVDKKVFKDSVKQYSINKVMPIKFRKNMRTKIRVVCQLEDCGWFVYASAHDKSMSVQVQVDLQVPGGQPQASPKNAPSLNNVAFVEEINRKKNDRKVKEFGTKNDLLTD
ncbi:hypothetical protein RJ640_012584 [Escallonia rubra]|uniref:Transposase MuDR plant domain-containing protein n=1 Tax=Escallonia rubra TaxID=112253 RepID=A0AA88QY47_9ASTE|nr:hypothetical protein RJ640_012584 [Escallonia rubra]